MTQKSSPSVRKAVELTFTELPDHFHAPFFCTAVKARTGRWALMDGTILRRLREARADNPAFNYRCIDPTISLPRPTDAVFEQFEQKYMKWI